MTLLTEVRSDLLLSNWAIRVGTGLRLDDPRTAVQ
jgi:hypothetical protein